MPTFSGQLGSRKAQAGLFQLGAAGDAPSTPPAMSSSARPYVAHLYNNDWSYRGALGPLLNRPPIRQVLNSGLQPISIQIAAANATIQPGNLVVLTEQGGNATGTVAAGIAVYGGVVEEVPDTIEPGAERHEVGLTPFVAELGDSFLNSNYSTATDVAQMVRDAVAQTNHLRVTPYSCPTTGVTATYNFAYAPCLEVINHARLIAGINWSWFVDAIGVVWFQPINTTSSPIFTVKGGVDYSRIVRNGGSISTLKNFAIVVGGIASGATGPTTATYSNATSQASYGKRALNPPVSIPGITAQTTLNNIATTIGGIYDRVINRVEIELPAYSQRILLGQQGGSTMRYWEPSKNSLMESETGSGGYSSTYVVQEVETDGIVQRVVLGDVPIADLGDITFQVEANLGRLAKGPIIQNPVIQPQSGGVLKSSSGSTLVDATGLLSGAVFSKPVGFVKGGAGVGNLSKDYNNGSPALVQDGATPAISASINVTPTRTTNYLVAGSIVVQGPTASAPQKCFMTVYVDGAQPTDAPTAFCGNDTAISNNTYTNPIIYTATLSAGTHTIAFYINANSANVYTMWSFDMYVFQLGS